MSDVRVPNANWPCEDCGKDGTPEDGHRLATSGRLKSGNLTPHTFCPACWAKRLAKRDA